MATYRIAAPNGKTYRIEGPEGATREQVVAALLEQDPSAAQAPTDTSGFTAAAASGIQRLLGETALTAGKLGLIDPQEAQRSYAARQHAAETRFKPTQEGWTESPFLKLRELAGSSVPYMLAPAAAGAAAAFAPVAAPAALGLGIAGLTSATQFTGSNLARQLESGKTFEETSLGKAAATAVPQALLDTAAMALLPGVGKIFGSAGVKVTEDMALKIAKQTLGKVALDYATATGKAMGREGITEAMQAALERLQAGLNITDPEARKEYIDNFIGGAALAGVLSPAGRAVERGGIKAEGERLQQQRLAAEAATAAANAPSEQETRAANLSKAQQLRTDMDAAMAQLKASQTPAERTALADKISTLQGELKGLQEFDTVGLQQKLAELVEKQNKAVVSGNVPEISKLGKSIAQLQTQLQKLGVDTTAVPAAPAAPAAPAETTPAPVGAAPTIPVAEVPAPAEPLAGRAKRAAAAAKAATPVRAEAEEPEVAPPVDELAAAVAALNAPRRGRRAAAPVEAEAAEEAPPAAAVAAPTPVAPAPVEPPAVETLPVMRARQEELFAQPRGLTAEDVLPRAMEAATPTDVRDAAESWEEFTRGEPVEFSWGQLPPALQTKWVDATVKRYSGALSERDYQEQYEDLRRQGRRQARIVTDETAPTELADYGVSRQTEESLRGKIYALQGRTDIDDKTQRLLDKVDELLPMIAKTAPQERVQAPKTGKEGVTEAGLALPPVDAKEVVANWLDELAVRRQASPETVREVEDTLQRIAPQPSSELMFREATPEQKAEAAARGEAPAPRVAPRDVGAPDVQQELFPADRALQGTAFNNYAELEDYLASDQLKLLRDELRAEGANIPYGETAARELRSVLNFDDEFKKLQIRVRELQKKREASRKQGAEKQDAIRKDIERLERSILSDANKTFAELATQRGPLRQRRAEREQRRDYRVETRADRAQRENERTQQAIAREQQAIDEIAAEVEAVSEQTTKEIEPLSSELVKLRKRIKSVEDLVKERAEAPIKQQRAAERAKDAKRRGSAEARTIANMREENARLDRLAELPTTRFFFEKEQKSTAAIEKQIARIYEIDTQVLQKSRSEAERREAQGNIDAIEAGLAKRFSKEDVDQLKEWYYRARDPKLTPEQREVAGIRFDNRVKTLKRIETTNLPAMQKAMAGLANVVREIHERNAHVEELLEAIDKLPPSKAAKKEATLVTELTRLTLLNEEVDKRSNALMSKIGVTSIKRLTQEERELLLKETGQLFYGVPKKVKGVDLAELTDEQIEATLGPLLRNQLWEHRAAPLMYSTKFAVAMRTGSAESKAGANKGGTQYGARQVRGRMKRAPYQKKEAYLNNALAQAFTNKTAEQRIAEVEEAKARVERLKGTAEDPAVIAAQKEAAYQEALAKYKARVLGDETKAPEIEERLAAEAEDIDSMAAVDAYDDDELYVEIRDAIEDDRYFRENNDFYSVGPTTPLSNAARKAVKDGDLIGALRAIEIDGSSEFTRELARKLQDYLQDTEIVQRARVTHDGVAVEGAYLPAENRIEISRDALNEEPLLHEATHAATLEVLAADPAMLTPEQRAARSEVETVYSRIRKNAAFEREYGTKSVAEFASEVMANQNLREKLDRVPSLFRRFMDAVLRMLGIKRLTLSEATVGNIYAMFKPSKPLNLEPQARVAAVAATLRGVFPATGSEAASWVPPEVVETSDALIARQASLGDKITANVTGLRLRTALVDRWAPIEALRKLGVAQGTLDAAQSWTVLAAMRLNEQRTQLVGTAVSDGVPQLTKDVDAQGRGTGAHYITGREGANLHQVHEALSKAKVGNERFTEQLFTNWLAVMRAERPGVGYQTLNFGNDANGRPLMDARKAQLIKNTVASDPDTAAAFEEARRIYKQYNSDMLKLLVDTGAMSEEKAAELLDGDYVPYYRVENGIINLYVPGSKPFSLGSVVDQPHMKELIGGDDKILPFFAGALQNTAMLIETALRNVQTKEVSYMLQKMGLGVIQPGGGPEGIGTLRFKQNGETYHLLMKTEAFPEGVPADLVVQGMQGVKTAIPQIVKLMAIPGDILRKSVTRMPTYALRQLIRDPMHAWLTTGGNFTPVVSSIKQLAKMVGKEDSTELSLQRAGVISSNVYAGDTRDTAMLLRNISKGGPKLGTMLAKWDALVLQGDASTRAVLYNKYREQGLSHLQASLGALESMNFSRRGTSASVHWLSVMIPFFNAQIQGLDAIWRAAKGDTVLEQKMGARQKLFTRGLMLAAASAAYALLMQDDDAYKNATEQERATSWFLRLPGTTETLRVPKPFELGFIFATLPELFINVAAGDTRASEAIAAMAEQLKLSTPGASNMFLPAGIKPLIELATNYNFFTGMPVETGRDMLMAPEERARPGTTETAKLMGRVLGVSPLAIEHLVRGYTSSMGLLVMSLPNMVLRPFTAPDAGEPVEKRLSEMPLFSTLFQPADGRGVIDAAFKDVERFQQAHFTFKSLMEAGRTEEALRFADKNANELALASLGGAFKQQMGELAQARRAVIASTDMSGAEKREMINEFRQIEIMLARSVRESALAAP